MLCLVAQSCPTLCNPMDGRLPGSSVHGGSSCNNTGVGCHALFQGIFPIQGSNPGLPHFRQSLPIIWVWRGKGVIDVQFLCDFLAVLCLVTQLCLNPCNAIDCSLPGSSVHWDSPSKNTGVCCHVLLQRIFPIQGSNPGLLHCRKILYHLPGKPMWLPRL